MRIRAIVPAVNDMKLAPVETYAQIMSLSNMGFIVGYFLPKARRAAKGEARDFLPLANIYM
jgi:hypothetical protein